MRKFAAAGGLGNLGGVQPKAVRVPSCVLVFMRNCSRRKRPEREAPAKSSLLRSLVSNDKGQNIAE